MANDSNIKKLALMPFSSSFMEQHGRDLLTNIDKIGSELFFCFIVNNRLAPLWLDYLTDSGLSDQISPDIMEKLKRQQTNAIAIVLMQTRVLHQVHKIFEVEKIRYLVFKGAGLRHTIYDNPFHRHSADIDILVNTADKEKAIASLAKAGFGFYCDKNNVSHEVTLTRHSVAIDLHWKLLRPGRTRIDMTAYLFKNRIKVRHFWTLNHQANLFVMLVHPIFTKHLNSPFALLINLVDLIKLTRGKECDWDQMVDILTSAGSKTAAWCSLYWLEKLNHTPVPPDVMESLQPGFIKSHCLRLWIERKAPEQLTGAQFQLARLFGLIVQDNIRDVLLFLRGMVKERSRASDMERILGAVHRDNYDVSTRPGEVVWYDHDGCDGEA